MSSDRKYTEILKSSDITPEIETIIEDYAQGWISESAIDIIDRIEHGGPLSDGTYADFGTRYSSPAITKARKIVREARA